MRKPTLTWAVYAIAALFAIGSAQAQVPHVFEPNTPARADEVNENFSTLSDSINALQAQQALTVYDATGAEIDHLGITDISTNYVSLLFPYEIDGNGYVFTISLNKDSLDESQLLYYRMPDCRGEAFFRGSHRKFNGLGFAAENDADGTISLSKGQPAYEAIESRSYKSPSSDCTNLSYNQYIQYGGPLVPIDLVIPFTDMYPPPYRLSYE